MKAYNVEEGFRIKHENGLNYEIASIEYPRENKVKVILRPYQNSMSASKKMTVDSSYDFQLIN